MIANIDIPLTSLFISTFGTITTILVGMSAYWIKVFIKEQKEADNESRNDRRTLATLIQGLQTDIQNLSENYKIMMTNTKMRLDSHAEKIDTNTHQISVIMTKLDTLKEDLSELNVNGCLANRKSGL